LTTERAAAEAAAARRLEERLQACRLGIAVRGIMFQDMHPPLAVVDSYRDVSRANSDRERRINEAGLYRDRILTEASGDLQAIRNAARAERERRVALAAAAADAFGALREARRCGPALTDIQLFWEQLALALGGKPKVILDDEPGRRRHLIAPGLPWEQLLPTLRTKPAAPAGAATSP
jgi:regulator of protease activity HflC (stomatin/prohibitin superfamily)